MERIVSSLKIVAGIVFLAVISIGIARSGDTVKSPDAMLPFDGTAHSPSLDDEEWIIYDDGLPQYYFPLPDEWHDHYFNVRFTPPDSCKLLGAALFFIQISDTVPDIKILVWNSTGLYPDSTLDSLTLDGDEIVFHPDSTYVPLQDWDLHFNPSIKFHIGWEPADSTDTLAILSDDGIPETTYSGEWWEEDNSWGTLQANWGLGVNFMIRALVEIIEDTTWVWLEPDTPTKFELQGPYPNPFNPATTFTIQLEKPQEVSLDAYDLSGRLVEKILHQGLPAGKTIVPWQPHGLASGTYLVKVETGGEVRTVRAVLLK